MSFLLHGPTPPMCPVVTVPDPPTLPVEMEVRAQHGMCVFFHVSGQCGRSVNLLPAAGAVLRQTAPEQRLASAWPCPRGAVGAARA